MKPNNFFLIAGKLCFALLLLFSLNCGKDADAPAASTPPPPPPPPTPACNNCQLLNYDGGNLNAPTLEMGTHQAAARFTPAKIGGLVGKTIKEIRYFIYERPDSIKVKLYGPNNETTPGNLLYSADVTAATEAGKWNVHTLSQAVTLKNEDIWLSIELKLAVSRKTIGCDAGPAVIDGDWLNSSSDNLWIPYNKRSSISINWNIRLNVEG